MLLRRELDAMSASFKIGTDSDTDSRASNTPNPVSPGKSSIKKKKKKSTKINDEIDEISCDEQRERLFHRPGGIIEEEPDSMDSIINDPSSYPITIVPIPSQTATGTGGVLIRSATAQSSVSRLSRISSNSKYVMYFGFDVAFDCCDFHFSFRISVNLALPMFRNK